MSFCFYATNIVFSFLKPNKKRKKVSKITKKKRLHMFFKLFTGYFS